MDKKYTPKSDFSGPIETIGLRSGEARWNRDDSGMRHIPLPVGETSPKTSRKDAALDFIRDALWITLGVFVALKILSFIGTLMGRLIGWAISFLF